MDNWLLHMSHIIVIVSRITAEIVLSLYPDENDKFSKTKRIFCSVYLSGSDKPIERIKRSSGVILAILSHFHKIEKAHIGAILMRSVFDSARNTLFCVVLHVLLRFAEFKTEPLSHLILYAAYKLPLTTP